MCGICGIIDFRGKREEFARRLPGMIESMRHRGPDESGTYADNIAGLGHARLSIIDLSDGRQPLSNEDGTVWITFNGEVYNFQPLREELKEKGHVFRTRTDTEVILHLYEEEGIDCSKRLRGMFAFGIWDMRKRLFFLSRDQIGIKPLYYTVQNGRLIFGSEIKAILAHGGIPRAVREDALSDYLVYLYVPAPKTMFEGIFKLEPGHWLRFGPQGCHTQPYWDLQPPETLREERSSIEHDLRERLSESVRLQLMSDVPLGAFLSGGVDSSSVVAMMRQVGHDPVVTASVGFEEERYNELPFARRVAQRYNTRHYERVVHPQATQVVEKLAWHYDEPFADHSAVPTYYVSQAAREHVTVALSGDGGDENFGGYSRYRWALNEQRIRRMIPSPLRRYMLGPLAGLYPDRPWMPRRLRAKSTLQNIARDPALAYLHTVATMDDDEKLELITPDFARSLNGYQSSDVVRGYMRKAARAGLNQLIYTEIKTFLVDDILTKVDRASMAVSLEVRVPFLDHTFVEYAHSIPEHFKIEGRECKAILKSAMRPFLDDETLYRRKQGFHPPIADWMRGPLRGMVEDLVLDGRSASRAYLRQDRLRKVWQEHLSGQRNNVMLLWTVLMFELWAKRFLTEAAGQP